MYGVLKGLDRILCLERPGLRLQVVQQHAEEVLQPMPAHDALLPPVPAVCDL